MTLSALHNAPTCIATRPHSNWSQIAKHKSAVDQKRAQLRTKLMTAIGKAVRAQGADPANNAWLARCLEEAKRAEVPKAVVERAVEKVALE